MNKLIPIPLLLILFTASIFTSCKDTLDLDDETIIKIEKQEKLKQLDELYDLCFTDPFTAEEKYNHFVKNELITAEQNFLVDLEISNRNSMTSLAIRLNTNTLKVQDDLPTNSLFELYKTMFENKMLNQSLLGEIPQQLKKGERLERFRSKINEANNFLLGKINDFKKNSQSDNSLMNKNWQKQDLIIDFVSFRFYNIDFNFTLKSDKSIDISSFYFLPHIPKNGSLLGPMDEVGFFKEEIEPNIISPYEYTVYGNKICFYFHFKNNYDHLQKSGKLEREWCYEYEYKVEGNQLTLSNPRVLFFMMPVMRETGYDDPIFQERYPDGLKQFVLTFN